jgi:hypothetical protein
VRDEVAFAANAVSQHPKIRSIMSKASKDDVEILQSTFAGFLIVNIGFLLVVLCFLNFSGYLPFESADIVWEKFKTYWLGIASVEIILFISLGVASTFYVEDQKSQKK